MICQSKSNNITTRRKNKTMHQNNEQTQHRIKMTKSKNKTKTKFICNHLFKSKRTKTINRSDF